MHRVYIIKSAENNWYYVGSTSNLEKRFLEHNNGFVPSTKARRPYILVYTEQFGTILEARAREKEIKIKRKLKEEIIKNLALSSNG